MPAATGDARTAVKSGMRRAGKPDDMARTDGSDAHNDRARRSSPAAGPTLMLSTSTHGCKTTGELINTVCVFVHRKTVVVEDFARPRRFPPSAILAVSP